MCVEQKLQTIDSHN